MNTTHYVQGKKFGVSITYRVVLLIHAFAKFNCNKIDLEIIVRFV